MGKISSIRTSRPASTLAASRIRTMVPSRMSRPTRPNFSSCCRIMGGLHARANAAHVKPLASSQRWRRLFCAPSATCLWSFTQERPAVLKAHIFPYGTFVCQMSYTSFMSDTYRPLEAFGLFVREARKQRQETQQKAAAGAGVSRKQWRLMEEGHNLSADFILKVVRYLGVTEFPLSHEVRAHAAGGSLNVAGLFALADEVQSLASQFAEKLRTFATDSMLHSLDLAPHAAAIEEFVREATPEAAVAGRPLTRAIRQMVDVADSRPATHERSERNRKRRTRRER